MCGVESSEAGTPSQTASPTPLRQALSVPAESFPHVHAVKDYAVLRRIGRLRHLQYVETQRKNYRSIVLDRDCLVEPEDFAAMSIDVCDASGFTCAMRIGEIGYRPDPILAGPDGPGGLALLHHADRRAPRTVLPQVRIPRNRDLNPGRRSRTPAGADPRHQDAPRSRKWRRRWVTRTSERQTICSSFMTASPMPRSGLRPSWNPACATGRPRSTSTSAISRSSIT